MGTARDMHGIGHNQKAGPTYAIIIDLDPQVLDASDDRPSCRVAYADNDRALKKQRFERRQDGVYLGDPDVTAVTCVLAAQDLARSFVWFKALVRDMRMVRIEEDTDLAATIETA